MKKPQSSLSILLLFALFAYLTQQYALEGSWSLTNHQDIKLDPSIDIEFQFTETITANLTISKTLIVHACYNLAYSYAVEENNIFITFLNIIDIPRKCQSGEISTVRSKVETVFYFVINGTSLTLYDPTGFAPFVFQNADSNVGPAINGGWQTLKINQNTQNSNVYINGSHAVLCNGNGVAIYNITSRSQVIFTILRSRGCDSASMDILSALDSTVFYRIRNNTYLYLYDYALNNVLFASMTSFVGFRQSLAFVSQSAQENKTQNEPTVKNNSIQITVNNTVVDSKKTQVKATADSNSTKTVVPASTPSNQTQTATNQSSATIKTTVQTPKAPITVNSSIGNSINSSSAVTNNSSPVLPTANANATPVSNPTSVFNATPVVNSKPISNPTPVSNSTPASNSTPTQVSATPSNQSSTSSSAPIQAQTSSSLTIQSNKPQQISFLTPSIPPPNEKPAVPPTPTPQKTISSISDLSTLNSKLIDGKWFISVLPGHNTSSLKTYYFIANSAAKRFIMYGGCNVQIYLYTLNNNQIAFGTPTSTTKVCTPNNDSIIANPLFKNSVYLEAIAGTLTFYDSQFAQTVVLSNTPPS